MKVAFLGNGAFGVPTLQALLSSEHDVEAVVTRPDRPSGRGRHPEPTPTKETALFRGLRIVEVGDLKAPSAFDEMSRLSSDLWVVVAFPIIPAPLLSIPAMGTLNLHASLLPRYRGAAPIQRALMNGEETTGLTTFFIDAGVDTGAICLQREVPIAAEETAGELSDRLSRIGAGLMLETLEHIERGEVPRIPQDPALATPAPRLAKEDGRLVWSHDAVSLANLVRAANPWPGAFTFAGGERLLVHRARALEPGEAPWSETPPPGTIGGFTDDGFPIVVAGDGGGVVLLQLQRSGRRAAAGSEIARGLRWQGGERLGEA